MFVYRLLVPELCKAEEQLDHAVLAFLSWAALRRLVPSKAAAKAMGGCRAWRQGPLYLYMDIYIHTQICMYAM